MRRSITVLPACLAIAAGLALAGPLPRTSDIAAKPVERDARLTILMRASVSDSRGERLGVVTDLVVDMGKGRIVHALVAPRPGLPAVACVLGDGGLTIASDGLLLPAEAATLAAVDSCGTATPMGTRSVLASRLLRTALVNVYGDTVGAIAEVVVRAHDGSLHYTIGDFGPEWLRDGLVAVLPVRPLTETGGGLRMVAYLADLHRMPVFDEARIADVWSPVFSKGVDKYLAGLASAPGKEEP